ncbi:MAG: alanine/glycine:cation symporter family protein [Bradymonadia bacterium]
MSGFVDTFNEILETVNGIIWDEMVLYVVMGVGVLFTLWSGFGQYRALTHGTAVTLGRYDDDDHGDGAISHFQALSAALSATVGLGNIGGVAVAIAIGGPGAVFWMWMVGIVGMALKSTEVTQSMLFRKTDDADNPSGGPMWVVTRGSADKGPLLAGLGKALGVTFCITLLISSVTGGNMFQAWNVADVTFTEFGMNKQLTGIILAVLVAAVILGGIKRIGQVAGTLVPLMCGIYLVAAIYVLIQTYEQIPAVFGLIMDGAFNPVGAQEAFLGGTMGYAFLWGMKRALFSSEAGQGSSPIAHSAARTSEPVREGVVAGLEPFIDTLVVCTLTALVLLSSGAWNRGAEATFDTAPQVVAGADAGTWTLSASAATAPGKTRKAESIGGTWKPGQAVFMLYEGEEVQGQGTNMHRIMGTIQPAEGNVFSIKWDAVKSKTQPKLVNNGLYVDYVAASLTSYAFNSVTPGLGTWLITIAAWLFALSTMISWSYYGEQGIVYLFGNKAVLPYKLIYCALIFAACSGLVSTTTELSNLTDLGTGVMLWANIPIMLLFAPRAMKAWHGYFARMKARKA